MTLDWDDGGAVILRRRHESTTMHESASPSAVSLLRLDAVEARTGLKKSAIYAGMKAGTFPRCVKLGPRASAWSSAAVDAWIADRIRSAPKHGAAR